MPIDPIVSLSPPTDAELEAVEREMLASGSSEDHLDWVAFMFFTHERWDKARDYYRRLVDRVPTNGSYHFYLAESLLQSGDSSEARTHWQRAVDLDVEGRYAALSRTRLAPPE